MHVEIESTSAIRTRFRIARDSPALFPGRMPWPLRSDTTSRCWNRIFYFLSILLCSFCKCRCRNLTHVILYTSTKKTAVNSNKVLWRICFSLEPVLQISTENRYIDCPDPRWIHCIFFFLLDRMSFQRCTFAQQGSPSKNRIHYSREVYPARVSRCILDHTNSISPRKARASPARRNLYLRNVCRSSTLRKDC